MQLHMNDKNERCNLINSTFYILSSMLHVYCVDFYLQTCTPHSFGRGNFDRPSQDDQFLKRTIAM